MIDFIAKLEGMLKTSGCEDYEIQYLPRGGASILSNARRQNHFYEKNC